MFKLWCCQVFSDGPIHTSGTLFYGGWTSLTRQSKKAASGFDHAERNANAGFLADFGSWHTANFSLIEAFRFFLRHDTLSVCKLLCIVMQVVEKNIATRLVCQLPFSPLIHGNYSTKGVKELAENFFFMQMLRNFSPCNPSWRCIWTWATCVVIPVQI